MSPDDTIEALRELRIDFKHALDDDGTPCIYVYGQNIDTSED